MTKKGTIILVSNTHWHHSWQTTNSMATGFATRGYNVLFIEPLPKRWPRLNEIKRVLGRLRKDAQAAGFVSQPLSDGVKLISPLALPEVGKLSQHLNQTIFIPRLAQYLQQQATSNPLIMIHVLPLRAAVSLQRLINPGVAIYRCVYDWSQDPYSGRKLAEELLLKHVDMVWADCEYNLKRVSAIQPRSLIFPPEVDLSLFTSVSYVPSDGFKPLCVCFGSMGITTDLDLLAKISHRYKLRLVGPILQRLEGFAETTEIVGPVPHEQIPLRIRDADILLLPYRDKPHMQGVIPAKLFECLVTGKPIVATNLTTVDEYSDLIYLCDTHDDVFQAIEMAKFEPDTLPARRIACAQKNGWEQCLTQMEQEIQALLTPAYPKESDK